MIDFAIFSPPRSRSTWTTAWLARYADVYHDPIARMGTTEILELRRRDPSRPVGIVCTASWLFDDILEAVTHHNTPVLCLTRPWWDSDRSMREIGLPATPAEAQARFDLVCKHYALATIPWWGLDYRSIAREILRVLGLGDLDEAHYREFRRMHIQPTVGEIDLIQELVKRNQEI